MKFTIDMLSEAVDLTGFEKYQKGNSAWLINDLDNHVTLEVVEAERVVEIHAYSSL